MTVPVEVAYATADHQRVASYELNAGACVADALAAAGLDPLFADLQLAEHSIGVFGRVCEPSTLLSAGDRVEIYRELTMDAKTARHMRARNQQESQQAFKKS